jgi:RHS repeat-associated protein
VAAVLGDVDGDGALDLVLANAAGQNRLLRNDGTGHFTDVTATHLPAQAAVSVGLALGDVDGDGAPDLLIANRSGPVWLWRNDGTGHFTDGTAGHVPATVHRTTAVALGDVDGDGAVDLVVMAEDAPPQLWRNNGLGVFTDVSASQLPATGEAGLDARFLDVDGDGALDLVLMVGEAGVQLWHNDGAGTFTDWTETHLPALPVFGITLAAGDVDEDGTVDLVLATAQGLTVLLNDGTGRFRNATPSLLPPDPSRVVSVALADVDDDLDSDLLLGSPGGPVRLLRNDLTTPRLHMAVTPTSRETDHPVTLTLAALAEAGLASATLAVQDPAGGAQTPSLATLVATGHATVVFTPVLAGTYHALTTITDLAGQVTSRTVVFSVQAADTTAPQVTLSVEGPTPLVAGQTVTVRVIATDDRRVVRTTLTIAGTPVPLATDGTASYPLPRSGSFTAAAQATDAAGNVSTATAMLTVLPDTMAPQVTVTTTPATVALAQPVTLSVTATDDVAVGPLALQLAGPALPPGFPLALDAQGHATYTPFHPGTYTATATAQDPAGNIGTGSATFDAQGVPDTTPPVVTLSGVPAVTTAVGRPLPVTVTATDNVGVTAITLQLNDTPQPLDAAGRAIITPTVVGMYTLVATAQDGAGNLGTAQATFQAIDASQDTEAPVVSLTAPGEDAVLTAPTIVRGTVQDATLVRWSLERSPRGAAQWTTLATGTTTVTEEVLGTFDPTLLLNDLYDLRLSAEDANGRSSTVMLVVRVTGNMKVGHLSFTLQDLTIPVVGLPITINRTYDSRDPRSGDFGHGWRLDVQSVTVRKNRVLGTGWQQGKVNTLTYCVEPQGAHYVTITLPDGRVEAFDLTLTPACQTLFPIQEATTTFTAQPGTFSTLEAVTDNTVLVVGALAPGIGVFAPVELVHFDASENLSHYDPLGYQLTTAEGLVLDLDQGFGVQRLTEPNGHTVPFGPGGLVHSAGPSVLFTRDAQGRITTITDPLGHTLTYTYDTAGDLVAVTDPEGHTTRYTYDSTHKLVAIADPRGVTVARTLYDDAGRVVAHLDAEGHRVEYTHDIDGRREMITDRLGQPTLYTYDEQGNVRSKTDSLGYTTAWTHNERSNILTETDPLGAITTFTYDERDRLLTRTNPLGHREALTYNPRGQVLTQVDPGGRSTTYTYDNQGNRTAITDPDGHVFTFTYNTAGNLRTQMDTAGNMTQFQYNSKGRLISLTNPLGYTIALTYDAAGNVLSLTPPGRPVHRFVYTDRGLEQAYKPPPLSTDNTDFTTTFTYDEARHRTHITRPDGLIVMLQYDATGRLLTQTFPMPAPLPTGLRTVHYAYDAAGQLVDATAADGGTLHHRYENGRRTLSTWGGRIAGHVSHAYDPAGRLVMQQVNEGYPIQFTYDAGDFLTGAGTLTLHRDPRDGRLTGSTLGMIRETMASDGVGEVRTVEATADGTVLLAIQYTRDVRGRIIQKAETIDGVTSISTYTYDPGGRLIEVTSDGTSTATYTYDLNGNRLTMTMGGETTQSTYDDQDRLLRTGEATYTYTANGELRYKTVETQTTTYAYDVLGNLLAVTFADGTQIAYVVDGQNRRIGKQVDGTIVQGFLYQDALHPVAELDGAGHVVARFVYASKPHVPDSMEKGGHTYRILSDHLGSPRLVVEVTTGQVAQRLDYDAFGQVLRDTNPGFQPFGFAGGLYDQDTRLTRFGVRDYEAASGRWTAKDQLLFKCQDTNLYGYVLNDPVNNTDPGGQSLALSMSTVATGLTLSSATISAAAFLYVDKQNIPVSQERHCYAACLATKWHLLLPAPLIWATFAETAQSAFGDQPWSGIWGATKFNWRGYLKAWRFLERCEETCNVQRP